VGEDDRVAAQAPPPGRAPCRLDVQLRAGCLGTHRGIMRA
jgi:hypothetical protein